MARIVPSDLHPKGVTLHGLGQAEPFTLKPGGELLTDDEVTIRECEASQFFEVDRAYSAPVKEASE